MKKIKKKRALHSMLEFDKMYFPKAFAKSRQRKEEDARIEGINLAKISIEEMKKRINKMKTCQENN